MTAADAIAAALEKHPDATAPISVIRDALRALGVRMNTSTLRSWRRRGGLEVVGESDDGEPLYRVADVLKIARECRDYVRRTDGEVGYSAVHLRLRKAFGSPRDLACVDCGEPGMDWSYSNADPNELEERRRRYSPDPLEYAPRCRRCHYRFDRGTRQ